MKPTVYSTASGWLSASGTRGFRQRQIRDPSSVGNYRGYRFAGFRGGAGRAEASALRYILGLSGPVLCLARTPRVSRSSLLQMGEGFFYAVVAIMRSHAFDDGGRREVAAGAFPPGLC